MLSVNMTTQVPTMQGTWMATINLNLLVFWFVDGMMGFQKDYVIEQYRNIV